MTDQEKQINCHHKPECLSSNRKTFIAYSSPKKQSIKNLFFFYLLGTLFCWVSISWTSQKQSFTPNINKGELEKRRCIAFTRRQPFGTVDSFRATIGKNERRSNKKSQSKAWWNLYQFDIHTILPNGTSEKRLTNDGISRKPRWSFNRNKIAYISGLDRSENLMVMNADGSEKKNLLTRQYKIYDFWWAPNDLAILVAVESRRTKDPMENWVIDIKNGTKTQRRMHEWSKGWYHWQQKRNGDWEVKEPKDRLLKTLPPEVNWPKWAPNQKYIAFATDGLLAVAEVGPVSVTGKWYLQRTEPPCTGIVDWSPDGSKILFYANRDICIATVQKGKITYLVDLSLMPANQATWNGDGSQIAFVSGNQNHRRSREIFVMSATTGQFQQITDTRFYHQDLDWR